MDYPQFVILISGKRKSGKDFVSVKLFETLGDSQSAILRISEPIKSHYAKEMKLDLSELLSDTPYKEQYRLAMINWSAEVRKQTPGYFCNATCTIAPLRPIWIVSDIRHKTDIKWFKSNYGEKIKTVRLTTGIEERQKRGWQFTKGVDDVSSECDLDDYTEWDLCLDNNTILQSDKAVLKIISLISH